MELSIMLKRIILLFTITQQLFSSIPAIYLNDLQRPFDEIGKPYLNPALGFIFATCLAEKMRLYGCYRFGFKDNGERVFAKDEGQDGVFQLIRLLFPSDGGNLSTVSNSTINFGSTLALGSPELQIQLITEILVNIDIVRTQKKPLRKPLEYTTSDSIAFQYPFISKKQNRNKCFDNLNQALLEALKLEAQTIYPKYFVEQIILGFFWQHFNTDQDLAMLVNRILEIYKKPADGGENTQMPKWTIRPFTKEQLDYLQAKMADSPENLSLEECLQLRHFFNLFTKITPYAEDETLITNGKVNLVQRDTAGVPHVLLNSNPFADCVDTAIRQLVNIIFYNPETHDFNYAKILACNNPDLAQFYGLHVPAEKKSAAMVQNIHYTNNGSTVIRNAWNCVVADLNHPNLPQKDSQDSPLARVGYERSASNSSYDNDNDNELHPGLINIANTLSRILGKPCITQEIQERILEGSFLDEDLLAQQFRSILNNPTVKITKKSQDKDDVYGELSFDIIANDKQQSFCLKSSYGHAELTNNTPPTTKPIFNLPSLELLNTLQSFRLLVPEWLENPTSTRIPLIYYLYSQPMQNNFDKLGFLWRLLNSSDQRFIIGLGAARDAIINEIPWEDRELQTSSWRTPIFTALLKQKFPELKFPVNYSAKEILFKLFENSMHHQYNNILWPTNNDPQTTTTLSPNSNTENTQALTINPSNQQLLANLAETHPDLTTLTISAIPSLTKLPSLPQGLEELTISFCDKFNNLNFLATLCPNLKKLNLIDLRSIFSLSLDIPEELTDLTISNLWELQSLNFITHDNSKLQTLNLSSLHELTTINGLPQSLVNIQIKGCHNSLNIAPLFEQPNLQKLELECSLTSLQKIFLQPRLPWPQLENAKIKLHSRIHLQLSASKEVESQPSMEPVLTEIATTPAQEPNPDV